MSRLLFLPRGAAGDIAELSKIGLERCATARCAIQTPGRLWNPPGRSPFFFARSSSPPLGRQDSLDFVVALAATMILPRGGGGVVGPLIPTNNQGVPFNPPPMFPPPEIWFRPALLVLSLR